MGTNKMILGLLFSPYLTQVVLYDYDGVANGLVDYVKDGELPIEAINRMHPGPHVDWKRFAILKDGDRLDMICYAARGSISGLRATPVADIPSIRRTRSLLWLVHLAIDHLQDGKPIWAHVTYPAGD